MSRNGNGQVVQDGIVDCPCDVCGCESHWSIANLEGSDLSPITRWFACGRHLHRVLVDGRWDMDVVEVSDLSEPVGGA